MGYEIHITRRSNWSDNSGKAITADEWSRVADADSSLVRVPDSRESEYEFANGDSYFGFFDGCISSKNPDQATIFKAQELALKLRAKVQGDDGEVYLPNGEQVNVNSQQRVVVLYPWWLLGLCLFSIGSFIVVIYHIATGR